jgi:hypothetical protein
VAFSRTCRLSVRPRAFAISDPPEQLLTLILRCSSGGSPTRSAVALSVSTGV